MWGVKDTILSHNCWEIMHLLKHLRSLPPECNNPCVKYPSQIAEVLPDEHSDVDGYDLMPSNTLPKMLCS